MQGFIFAVYFCPYSLDPELFADQQIPVLIVGTKKVLLSLILIFCAHYEVYLFPIPQDLVGVSSGKPSTGSSLTGAACVNVVSAMRVHGS